MASETDENSVDAWAALEALDDGIALLDSRGAVVHTTARCRALLPVEDHLWTPGLDLRCLLGNLLSRSQIRGIGGREESWLASTLRLLCRSDGATVDVELPDNQWRRLSCRRTGQDGHVFAVADITTARLREQAVAESERRVRQNRAQLAQAIDSLHDAFVLFDAEDRLVLCNSRYIEFLGPLGERVRPGASFMDLTHAAVEQGVFDLKERPADLWLAERLADHTDPRAPREMSYADGRWTLLHEARTPDGGCVAIETDITERRRTEQALSLRERRLNGILDTVVDAIITIDERGLVQSFNKAAERIFGWEAEEVLGRSINLLMPKRQRHRHDGHIDHYLKTGERKIIGIGREEMGMRKDGSEFPIDLAVSELRLGSRILFTGVIRDITERKRAEQDILLAKEQAELASRAKTEFLANMSHELRTPLNAIIGFSEILQSELIGPLSPAQYRDYAGNILESGRHLLDVINDILDVSRIEAGAMTLHPEAVNLKTVVDSALRLISVRAAEADVALSANIPPDLPFIWGEERRLKQILLNLLGNAVKFTPNGGSVTLFAESNPLDGSLMIRIRDTGIGMTPDEVALALEPFRQIDSRLARRYEGTGLGLPLTRSFVEMHGGTMALDSTPGQGTTVTVQFPALCLVRESESLHA